MSFLYEFFLTLLSFVTVKKSKSSTQAVTVAPQIYSDIASRDTTTSYEELNRTGAPPVPAVYDQLTTQNRPDDYYNVDRPQDYYNVANC